MHSAVFGFFPDIQPERYGGVEESGRLAWEAVRETVQNRGETATLFCYGGGTGQATKSDFLSARTKPEAIRRILRGWWHRPCVILVWHLALSAGAVLASE